MHRIAALIALCSCTASQPSSQPQPPDTPATAAPASPPWTHAFDFDGDGERDRVAVEFSGGAHCCYTVATHLSSGESFELPFELDGGYIAGLDLSQPSRFTIRDANGDGLPDLVMTIGTYNGEALPLPASWRAYGISGHHIVVSFAGGKLHVSG